MVGDGPDGDVMSLGVAPLDAPVAQVRHGTIDFSDFEAAAKSKYCLCSSRF
jgi:hypothetical protein